MGTMRYIALEGIDGSGKTTQARLLHDRLEDEGWSVQVVSEPTSSLITPIIRDILQSSSATNTDTQHTLALLFAADRLQQPQTDADYIISDRSYVSSLAYQPDPQWTLQINRYAPKPDHIYYLDLPLHQAIQRTRQKDTFENPGFLEQVQKNYHHILPLFPHTTIDATQTPKTITKTIHKTLLTSEKIS